jgi:3',5'-nucleoside bisphosphate phosphatase
MKADLHLHSIYSDGVCKPEEIIRIGKKNRLEILSLTDHDCVKGIDEFIKSAKDEGLKVITGVELSSYYNGREIHILGYGFDHKSKTLAENLVIFKRRRLSRAHKIVKKLNDLRINLAFSEIRKFVKKGLYGRMHIARALLAKQAVGSLQEAFYRYLANGKPAYVPKVYFDPEKAIELINSSGGYPVIAHPSSSGLSLEDLGKLKEMGIAGIECIHPKHAKNKEKRLVSTALKLELFATGGSDFHGVEKIEFDNFGLKYVTLTPQDKLIKCLKSYA